MTATTDTDPDGPATCRTCGCTEDCACLGGCAWAALPTQTTLGRFGLCTACAAPALNGPPQEERGAIPGGGAWATRRDIRLETKRGDDGARVRIRVELELVLPLDRFGAGART
jgi:hypothetical protein